MANKSPFSPIRKAGNLFFTSGQVHLTPEGHLLKGTIKEQTRQVMENLQNVLEKEGLTLNDVVKTTIFLTNMTDYQEMNGAYIEYFENEFPAREAIGVKELPLGAKIEISLVAYKLNP